MVQQFRYYIFYKPFQVLSSFTTEDEKATLANYFHNFPKDVYPIGRLDYDSEGLLLLTNDKSLNYRLLHPKFGHNREYWCQVEGIPNSDFFKKINEGVQITAKEKAFKTQPALVRLLEPVPKVPERNPPIRYRKNIPTSWVAIQLSEGKNRQVRKMTAAAGNPTLRLIRWRIEKITLAQMKPGDIVECPNMPTLLGIK